MGTAKECQCAHGFKLTNSRGLQFRGKSWDDNNYGAGSYQACPPHPPDLCRPAPAATQRDPQPSTLNPQPLSFNSQPSTLPHPPTDLCRPAPAATQRDPQLSTLNPKPSTLNPAAPPRGGLCDPCRRPASAATQRDPKTESEPQRHLTLTQHRCLNPNPHEPSTLTLKLSPTGAQRLPARALRQQVHQRGEEVRR